MVPIILAYYFFDMVITYPFEWVFTKFPILAKIAIYCFGFMAIVCYIESLLKAFVFTFAKPPTATIGRTIVAVLYLVSPFLTALFAFWITGKGIEDVTEAQLATLTTFLLISTYASSTIVYHDDETSYMRCYISKHFDDGTLTINEADGSVGVQVFMIIMRMILYPFALI